MGSKSGQKFARRRLGNRTKGHIKTIAVSRTRASRESDECINRIPTNQLTFLAQINVVYGIISVSLYHLRVQSQNQELLLVLLSSAFGYILPSPVLKFLKWPRVGTAFPRAESTPALDRDSNDGCADKEKGKVLCSHYRRQLLRLKNNT